MSADRINPAGNRRTVTYKGVAMAVADVPNPYLQAMLGYGHYPDHNRPVLAGGWPWKLRPPAPPTTTPNRSASGSTTSTSLAPVAASTSPRRRP